MPSVVPPISRPFRLLVLAISLAVLLSAVLLAALAAGAPLLARDQRPSWALFGFEVVIAVAGVLGVLTGRGRFADGPGLALACVAGTILIGSGLGWQGAGRQLLGVPLLPVLGGRALAALVLGAIGAWTVLSRDTRAIRLAITGMLLLLPVVLGAVAVVRPAGRRLLDKLMGTSPGIQFMVAVGGFAVAAVLLSAGCHLIIRAFELGRPTSERV
jgi:hypothetical protein